MKSQKQITLGKRGQSAQQIFGGIFVVAGGVMVVAVIVIMLAAFQGTQTVDSLESNIIGRGLTFADNATNQFGTAGTILGVLFLLGVLGLGGLGIVQGVRRLRS